MVTKESPKMAYIQQPSNPLLNLLTVTQTAHFGLFSLQIMSFLDIWNSVGRRDYQIKHPGILMDSQYHNFSPTLAFLKIFPQQVHVRPCDIDTKSLQPNVVLFNSQIFLKYRQRRSEQQNIYFRLQMRELKKGRGMQTLFWTVKIGKIIFMKWL